MKYIPKNLQNKQKLLQIINKFSKSIRHKMNIQNSIVFPHNSRKPNEFRKAIPFIIASKGTKYLRINLTKEVVLVHLGCCNKIPHFCFYNL
jgi:hypothetical protein